MSGSFSPLKGRAKAAMAAKLLSAACSPSARIRSSFIGNGLENSCLCPKEIQTKLPFRREYCSATSNVYLSLPRFSRQCSTNDKKNSCPPELNVVLTSKPSAPSFEGVEGCVFKACEKAGRLTKNSKLSRSFFTSSRTQSKSMNFCYFWVMMARFELPV